MMSRNHISVLVGSCTGRYDDYWWRDIDTWPWREQRRKNWQEAGQFCSEKGGDLVKIGSQEESTFITDKLGQDFWLGANDKETEGSWLWTDGTPVSWTNWNSGEPDGEEKANCARMRPDGKWSDSMCSKRRPFLCSVQVRNKLSEMRAVR